MMSALQNTYMRRNHGKLLSRYQHRIFLRATFYDFIYCYTVFDSVVFFFIAQDFSYRQNLRGELGLTGRLKICYLSGRGEYVKINYGDKIIKKTVKNIEKLVKINQNYIKFN